MLSSSRNEERLTVPLMVDSNSVSSSPDDDNIRRRHQQQQQQSNHEQQQYPNSNNSNNNNHNHHQNQGRILDRDADYFQSRGRWSGVELHPQASGRRNRSSLTLPGQHHPSQRQPRCSFAVACFRRYWPRLWDDWFHTLAYQRTILIMLVLLLTYVAIVGGFAVLYWTVSIWGTTRTQQADGSFVTTSFCGMDINDHMDALYFSLSTMATIGYGVSDYYFGGCWTPLLLVLTQVCTAITFDACAVGLLFTRLSRGRKRGKSIVVSNQAAVQVVQGVPFFMLRVGELRRFPLIDASVRLYCIRHERIPRVNPFFSTLGLVSFTPTTLTPTTTTRISSYQDLASAARESEAILNAKKKKKNSNSNDVTHSTTTAPTSNTHTTPVATTSHQEPVPIETTHFMTRAMKLLHPDESLVHSNYILMSLPQVIVHRMDASSPLMPPSEWYDAQGQQHIFPQNSNNALDIQAQVQAFWKDRGLEVVVLVEGTDELTGAAIQARHSYSTASPPPPPPQQQQQRHSDHNSSREDQEADHTDDEGDVVWNRAFVNCILPCNDPEGMDNQHQSTRSRRQQQQWSSQQGQYPVCTVDFSRFHDTVPTPHNCFASPHVPFTTSL